MFSLTGPQADIENNVIIYSTGGTQTYLENLGIKVLAVEDQTNYPPVFGGRVKTLHPAIFGGILFRRGLESDQQERETHKNTKQRESSVVSC